MKIPKKISVLGVPYKVQLKDKLENDAGDLSDTHLGWTIEGQHIIQLATTDLFCDDIKEQTLFHELVHAIMYESGLTRAISEDDNEVFAQVFGNAFHQIFKQML